MQFRLLLPVVAAVFVGACSAPVYTPAGPASAPAQPASSPPRVRTDAVAKPPAAERPSASRKLSNDIHWFRASAEYRALARQAYQTAGDRLPLLVKGLAKRRWAVVLDADETVLDNSEYERRRFLVDSGYSEASWDRWVDERAAKPIPGAAEFTRRVRALGGRVAIVTNRSTEQCGATRDNLTSVGVDADIVLCQPAKERDKNPRFQRLEAGTAAAGMPKLRIVEWIGDNITDFPGLTQVARSEPGKLAEFGKRYFMLPNPMYGSWEANREP